MAEDGSASPRRSHRLRRRLWIAVATVVATVLVATVGGVIAWQMLGASTSQGLVATSSSTVSPRPSTPTMPPAMTTAPASPTPTPPAPSPTSTTPVTSLPPLVAVASYTLPCSGLISASALAAVEPGLTLEENPENYLVSPQTSVAPTTAGLGLVSQIGPPEASGMIAAAQSGYFSCEWRTAVKGSAWTNVAVGVLPDATAAFTAQQKQDAGVDSKSGFSLAPIALGDRSVGLCYFDGFYGGSCTLDVLTGAVWTELTINPAGGTVKAANAAEYRTVLSGLMTSVLASVAATGTEPRPFTDAVSSWSGAAGCERVTEGVASVIRGAKYDHGGLDATDADTPLYGDAEQLSGGYDCFHQAVDGSPADIWVVPGAASWAFPATYVGFDDTASVTNSPVSIPGTAGAEYVCLHGGYGGCWLDAAIDGALVTVPAQGGSAQKTEAQYEAAAVAYQPTAVKIMAAIAAAR